MTVEGEIVARDAHFPEGPVWRNEELVFTEIQAGVLTRWTAGAGSSVFATTGGGPNGAAAGPDGAIFVTQNGGMHPGPRAAPGIQRVDAEGHVETILTSVGDLELGAPNDLAFGPDGRLWFTDPRGAPDPGQARPGRLFALDLASGKGELIIELEPVFPNGIAFLGDGTLVWTESLSRRVMALVDSQPEVVIQLPERHMPDGMCVGEDGRLYVASTYAHCVSVVDQGEIVDRLMCGDGMATNCCFGGTALYVTESRRGTIWRYALGKRGLALPY
jgi:gluconolactonase